jgi:hypothetical protein
MNPRFVQMLTPEQNAKLFCFKGEPTLESVVKHVYGSTVDELNLCGARETWNDDYSMEELSEFIGTRWLCIDAIETAIRGMEETSAAQNVPVQIWLTFDTEADEQFETSFKEHFPLTSLTSREMDRRIREHVRDFKCESVAFIENDVLPGLERTYVDLMQARKNRKNERARENRAAKKVKQ